MEKYLQAVLEQIRCKKVHPYIREELMGHIQDQIEDNRKSGMSEKEAEEAAVRDMGDPVEIGVEFDRIHRPQIAWKMLIVIGVISLLGILVHFFITRQIADGNLWDSSVSGSSRYAFHVLIGLALMFVVYRIDYTYLAKYAKVIAAGILLFGLICLYAGTVAGGVILGIHVGGSIVAVNTLLMLYVPIYAAVVYKYHGEGYAGIVKSIVWMLLPVYIAIRLPRMPLALMLFVSMLVVLMIGIWKGWFQVAKKRAFIMMGLVAFGFPVGGLGALVLMRGSLGYYIERVQSFYMDSDGLAYYASMLDSVRDNAKWIGNSGMKFLGFVQDGNRDFILSYVTASYGLLAAIIVCCLLAVFVVFIFSASLQQKNQLGLAMGCGCGMIFLMNLGANILINMRIVPTAWTFLPFLSAGGNNIVLCYVLVGIVLSIYRYKNIYPMHVSTNLAFPGKNVQ